MNWTTENLVTIAVAIVAGIPGIVTLILTYKTQKKTKKVDMTEAYLKLLSITSTFDRLFRRLLIDHPEINGELRQTWLEASAELEKLIEKTK